MQSNYLYKKGIFFFVITLSLGILNAQEYLGGIGERGILKKIAAPTAVTQKQMSTTTVSLPFLDDFSVLNYTPDQTLWADRQAFINDNYPVNQPTIGVATLDAIDGDGNLYAFPDTASTMPGDTLTSQLIDAAGLSPADSLYLTFFVQGGGMGNTPQSKDSLIVQMYFQNDSSGWNTVWSDTGRQMNNFEPVRIPITDQSLIHENTRFRFINYFSMEYAGMNCDHWHIDYVMMDKNRSVNDSLIDEVAYTKNINNIFGVFSAVPWRHFKNYYGQILDNREYNFRNYSENTMNITPYFRWTNLYTGESEDRGNIANNYEPDSAYEETKPINGSLFTLDESDSAKFELENRFYISETDYAPNNSTSRIVDLYNYYAYDDGSAEGMYGVSNKYGMVAVKYTVYQEDSLKAIRIYFNKSVNDENRYFNLMVWDEGGSGPGEVLFKKTRNLPAYADSINGFVTYELDSAVAVGETFYIGWQKITDQRLNMGFDKNFVAYQKNYYNSNGKWELSEFSGSLMIRPVMRKMYAYKDSFLPDNEPNEQEEKFSIYPNPVGASGYLNIRTDVEYLEIMLYNQTGRLVYSGTDETVINMTPYQRGLYILRLSDGQKYYAFKIIKQ